MAVNWCVCVCVCFANRVCCDSATVVRFASPPTMNERVHRLGLHLCYGGCYWTRGCPARLGFSNLERLVSSSNRTVKEKSPCMDGHE
eukprot:scaffold2767_cov177-Amphora_coffeaeformis.AAC.33